MAKRWYVVHTYSGYENKVKTDLEHRIETYGMEDMIVDIQIPTEEVTEIKEGGKRVEVKPPTLAPSAPDPRDYRDIAVLAFPATAGQWGGALTPAKVTRLVMVSGMMWA